ncbi:MAG: hypothetical protein COY80_03725 [Candidatus Pacebacteria bacterium CG_4_10_14_0_8_um_filter_42_14]|nr:MAG: hypothetical protein COY80_03725 [Candidatus Pacebacteria bacterium CG_4_10_14_0_8_um_filter_42_14]
MLLLVVARKHQSKRASIFQVITLVALLAITLITVTQLPIIRQFLSFASNPEPANIVVDTQSVLGPMPRPWRNLAQGGESSDWDIKPISGAVAALHPEYIRVDHLFDFYDIAQGTPGNLTFNFTKLDVLLDGIAATGAKPYIALSYLSPNVSDGDIVGQPARYEDWQLMVQKTIEHISGTRRTRDVYYEVWNEPDLFGSWMYYGDKSYLKLYAYAAAGANQARGVHPFKIGGPATTGFYKNWFDALANYAVKNKVRLDFISWHRYSTNVDQFRQDIYDISKWVGQYPQLEPTIEFHITEWGHNSENNAGYDGAYGAAHTVAASIEMVGVVQRAFAFEIQDGKDPAGQEYWGRWGLLTNSDFGSKPKPRYYALRLLDSIGVQRVQLLGKGTYVKALAAKTEDGAFEVLLSNFDSNGRNAEQVPITFDNLPFGKYTIKKDYLAKKDVIEVLNVSEGIPAQIIVPMGPLDVVKVTVSQ